jgi:flagellar biogenesis protein FliO
MVAAAVAGLAMAAGAPAAGPDPAAPAAPPAAAPPATEPTAAPAESPPRLGKAESLRLGRDDGDFGKVLTHSLAAILIILVLGGVAIIVIRRLLPRMGLAQGRRIAVLETVYLGTHKSLHLVEVGDRILLLAGTRERLSMLTDLTEALSPESRSPPSSGRAKATFALPDSDEPSAGEEGKP